MIWKLLKCVFLLTAVSEYFLDAKQSQESNNFESASDCQSASWNFFRCDFPAFSGSIRRMIVKRYRTAFPLLCTRNIIAKKESVVSRPG